MDRDAIRAAKAGDLEARKVVFRWLIDKFDRKLDSRLDDHRDALQEALADILAKLTLAPEEPDAFSRWAGGFVRIEKLTEYRDHQRRRALRAKLEAHTELPADERPSTPRSRIARHQWYSLLLHCIEGLPEIYRRTLLHYVDGGSHSQLAALEGIDIEAAYQRLSHGKQLVRRMLAELRITRSTYRSPPRR